MLHAGSRVNIILLTHLFSHATNFPAYMILTQQISHATKLYTKLNEILNKKFLGDFKILSKTDKL